MILCPALRVQDCTQRDSHKSGGPSALMKCVSDHWVVEISKLLFFDRMPAVFLS